MVAFSGVSMANIIGLEKEVVISKINIIILEDSTKPLPPSPTQCQAISFEAYNRFRDRGFSEAASSGYASQTYFACMGHVFD
jgi:hypothetical protein